jgi:hypothetical protein
MREMVLKEKHLIAEEYLKKALLYFSSNFSLLARLLLYYSKIIKSHYPSSKIERSINFMIEAVKKAAIPVSDELYTNLQLFIQINVSNKLTQKSLLTTLYTEKLHNGSRKA